MGAPLASVSRAVVTALIVITTIMVLAPGGRHNLSDEEVGGGRVGCDALRPRGCHPPLRPTGELGEVGGSVLLLIPVSHLLPPGSMGDGR